MRAVSVLAVACAPGLVGCHVGLLMAAAGTAIDQGPYRAETMTAELGASSMRTLGCLDVGLALHERDARDLLDVHIGNRCGHPEALDLRRLTIRGVDGDGQSRTITLYDPHGEILPFHVGGAERGRERLRVENARDLTRLCFDLENIAPDAPAARPLPLCFDRKSGAAALLFGNSDSCTGQHRLV